MNDQTEKITSLNIFYFGKVPRRSYVVEARYHNAPAKILKRDDDPEKIEAFIRVITAAYPDLVVYSHAGCIFEKVATFNSNCDY